MEDAVSVWESGIDIFKKSANGVTYVGMENGSLVYTVGSGTYHFCASTY
jgi:hypothetical protein